MYVISKLTAGVAMATVVVGATLAVTSPASANTYDLNFTDTHGDVADLVLTTAGAYGTVLSITGTFDSLSVSETSFAGSDQQIYSAGPFVDYPGIAWTNGIGDYNLYWTNPSHSFSTPGPYGVCYVGSCNETSGFYRLTSGTVNGVSLTPLPSTWTMLIAGFLGLGFFASRGTKKSFAAA